MAMDNKKKGLLILLIGAAVGVAALFVFLAMPKEEQEVRKVNIVVDAPQASVAELPANKRKAYETESRQSDIDRYWDQLGEESVQEDPLAELNGEKSNVPGGRRNGPEVVSVDDIFGSSADRAPRENPSERAERRNQENAKMVADMQAQQMQMLNDIIVAQQQAQAGKPAEVTEDELLETPAPKERERIDVESVRVVKSGGISSMDDEFGNVATSGISTLDSNGVDLETDEAYPFKCMFVRQEKLKSGQRVSIRLLEDIVVEGQLVKKNTHLNAVCTIGDRIDIKVSNIELPGRIVNLDFDGYDNDGVRGIYAPDLGNDNTLEDALKQAGVSAVRRRANTLVGQTVQDILSAGSMVITGTGRDRSVMVPSGYQFYLVRHKK